MGPAKKTHAMKRHRQSGKFTIAIFILFLVAVLVMVGVVWYPGNFTSPLKIENPQVQPTPSPNPSVPFAFNAFTDHYLSVMENLNSGDVKSKMAPLLNQSDNQTDLFAWEHSRLTFVQDPAGWSENPIQILNSGKGICVQWSVVYISACLALNYQSRLVVAVDTSTWTFIHTWAEDYYNGTWVHVDPSDSVWNNPARYLSWDWGKYIGSQVKIYTFENGAFQDVTAIYSAT